jgi:RNA polymerase sigma factor (sigma-70 family)
LKGISRAGRYPRGEPMIRIGKGVKGHEDDLKELTDSALLAGVAAGRIALMGELYTRHERRVKAMLRCSCPSMPGADVEDIAQDVFISLGRTAGCYENQANFKGWLYRIVKRKLTDWRRKAWVRRRFFDTAYAPVAMAKMVENASPEGRTGLREAVAAAFSRLPDEQREVLWLHFVEGLDGEEIAGALGVRRATVYTRINRARTTLLETCKETP